MQHRGKSLKIKIRKFQSIQKKKSSPFKDRKKSQIMKVIIFGAGLGGQEDIIPVDVT